MSFFFKALDTSTSLRPKVTIPQQQPQQQRQLQPKQQQMMANSPYPGIRTPAEAGT